MTPDPTQAHDRLKASIANLVLALRLAADDLAQVEPTDAKELEGKLGSLIDTVMERGFAISDASDLYDQVAEEPNR